jgi:hypothetical protein
MIAAIAFAFILENLRPRVGPVARLSSPNTDTDRLSA